MQNKLMWHQLVLIGVLFILTMIRMLVGAWSFGLPLLWWWLGGIIGFLLVFGDRFIYVLVGDPGAILSVRVKERFKAWQVSNGFETLLSERHDQGNLAMRSALFVAAWIVLGFMAMMAAQVTPPIVRGIVLGVGTHLVFDLVWDYFDKTKGVTHWFWQIKRVLSEKEKTGFVVVTTVLYLLIIWGL